MLNLEEINKNILELETMRDTTWNVVERLSWLYTVRDHIQPATKEQEQVFSGDSEFYTCICDKDLKKVMSVMNELMETLAVLNPSIYKSVIRKIED